MKKTKEIEPTVQLFLRPSRIVVPVPSHVESQKVETIQGKSQNVRQLYEDYVLGRLDQSQIGGQPVYDDDNASDVDPFNNFGLTLEETTAIADAGSAAASAARKHVTDKKTAKEKEEFEKRVAEEVEKRSAKAEPPTD